MKGNMQETWTMCELYEVYSTNLGALTQKQMFAHLCEYFGKEIVVLNVEGCETVVGFKNYIAKTLKMVKRSKMDDEDEVDKLIRRIKSEVARLPKPKDSLNDEFGCLRKGDKSVLVKRLGVPDENAPLPNVVLVDGSQLLYHIVWPVAGTIKDIASSINTRLSTAAGVNETLVIFDRYNDKPTAKDHERRRRGGIGAIDYKMTVNTPLPCRGAVMKGTSTKTQLLRLLCTFDLTTNLICEPHRLHCEA
ncbi:unnamed protein product [Arctogadus glacialis]